MYQPQWLNLFHSCDFYDSLGMIKQDWKEINPLDDEGEKIQWILQEVWISLCSKHRKNYDFISFIFCYYASEWFQLFWS